MIEGSFMKALFFGVIAEDVIFPFPQIEGADAERVRELCGEVRRAFDGEIDPRSIDEQAVIGAPAFAALRRLGLFGLSIPREFGGLGLGASAVARVIQEVACFDASVAIVLCAHGELAARAILLHGTPAQKQRLLPRLASGEVLGAFALAERASGSDAGAIQLHAERVPEGDGWLLSGAKHWVTGGAYADLFVVFARTSRIDEGQKPRIAALCVERGAGVERGACHDLLGLRGSGNCDISFERVALGSDAVLGEAGRGYRVAMETLSLARVALAASLVGQARSLVTESVLRVQKRRSFGRAIGEFPIIKDKIARMIADTYAIESMTHLCAGLADRGVEDASLESAICRVAGAEALWRVLGDAMQIAAARGYVRPHRFERQLRDARVGFLVDATNETLRCFIALGGMQAPGRRLQEVGGSMREPVKGFGLLREFAVRKVREALRRERITRVHPVLGREAVIFEQATDALGRAVERALRDHGTEIAEMQTIQMRVADTAIDLWALAACLSRTSLAIEQRGEEGARRKIDLTTMFANAAEARMQRNLGRIFENDDELRKLIAARAYADKGYPFDVI